MSDVLIVGAGMTGLSLALALSRENLSVSLLDQRPIETDVSRHPDGRVTAIALGSARALGQLCDWSAVSAHCEAIREIEVSEDQQGSPVRYLSHDVGAEALGYIAPNNVLATELASSVNDDPNITVLSPGRVHGYEVQDNHATLHLEDGRSLTASLIAACDGRQSALRRLAGIVQKEHDYRQTGLVCVIRHERDHHGVAIERFFPSGPFAVLPLPGKRCSIVWALENERAREMIALGDDAFAAEIATRFSDRLGLVAVEGKRFSFPLKQVQSHQITADRLALVGDAARTIHPIAGQGWNVGLRDALSLAEIAGAQHRLGLDIGGPACLSQYDKWRMTDSRLLADITHGINGLFSNDVLPLRWARQLGFGIVERTPPIKAIFMRHAMADLGDLPKLMRAH